MGKTRTIEIGFPLSLEETMEKSVQYWQTSKFKPEITTIADIPEGKKLVIKIKSTFMRGTGSDWEIDVKRAPEGTHIAIFVSLEWGWGTAWTIPMTIVKQWCKFLGYKQKVKWLS